MAPHIKDDFVLKADQYYQSKAQSAAFDDKTLAEINQWVAEKTKNTIPHFLDKIDPNTA